MLVSRSFLLAGAGISIVIHSVKVSGSSRISICTSLNGQSFFTPIKSPPLLFFSLPTSCVRSCLGGMVYPGILERFSVVIILVSWIRNTSISFSLNINFTSSSLNSRASALKCSIFVKVSFTARADQKIVFLSYLVSAFTVSKFTRLHLVIAIVFLLRTLWGSMFRCRHSFISTFLTPPLFSSFNHFVDHPSGHAVAIQSSSCGTLSLSCSCTFRILVGWLCRYVCPCNSHTS